MDARRERAIKLHCSLMQPCNGASIISMLPMPYSYTPRGICNFTTDPIDHRDHIHNVRLVRSIRGGSIRQVLRQKSTSDTQPYPHFMLHFKLLYYIEVL